MQITPTALPDVPILEPRVFADERGFVLESFNQRAFDVSVDIRRGTPMAGADLP